MTVRVRNLFWNGDHEWSETSILLAEVEAIHHSVELPDTVVITCRSKVPEVFRRVIAVEVLSVV